MPRNCGRNHHPAPSAPPEHFMPRTLSSQHHPSIDTQDWDPPPRYEVAIAADHRNICDNGTERPSLDWPSQALPSPTSQRLRQRGSSLADNELSSRHSQHHRNHDRSSIDNGAQRHRHLRHTGNPTNTSGSQRRRGETRSASPSGLSNNGGRSTSSSSPKRKRGAGYKIKKGLEGIAYGIIQILD